MKALAGTILIVAGALAAWMLAPFGGQADFGDLRDYAIVQSLDAPELVLVDTRKQEVAGTIPLPVVADALVASAAAERVVYANRAARSLAILDIAEPAAQVVLDLPISPDGMVLSPDGFTVAVADQARGAVALVSLAETTLIGVIEGLGNPKAMTFSDRSEFLFVSDSEAREIAVIDAIAGVEMAPVPLDLGSAGASADLTAMTRTPSGLFGLVVDRSGRQMALVNFRNWQQTGTLPLGSAPSRPYGTADGRFMLVANTGDRTLSVISTEFFDEAAVLPGVSGITGISTGYLETLAFVVSGEEERAVLVDLETLEAAGSVDLTGGPGIPVADADGARIYVALADTNELVIFDAAARKIVANVGNVGHRPSAVVLAETNNYCH